MSGTHLLLHSHDCITKIRVRHWHSVVSKQDERVDDKLLLCVSQTAASAGLLHGLVDTVRDGRDRPTVHDGDFTVEFTATNSGTRKTEKCLTVLTSTSEAR